MRNTVILILGTLACLLLVFFMLPNAVFAQDGGGVIEVPWGEWISVILANSGEIILLLVGALFIRVLAILPKPLADWLRTMQVEQLLARGVDYGLEAVAGAAKDQRLSIPVGSAVVAEATNYVIKHGPGRLVGWMGGPEMIAEKILARLNLDPDANDAAVLIPANAVIVSNHPERVSP